jgi:hypothetical protein
VAVLAANRVMVLVGMAVLALLLLAQPGQLRLVMALVAAEAAVAALLAVLVAMAVPD